MAAHLPEGLFESVFHQFPYPRIIIQADSPKFTIVTFNEKFQEISYTKGRDLVGSSMWDIYPEDEATAAVKQQIRQALNKVIITGKSVTLDSIRYDIPAVNNSTVTESWWQAEYSPITGTSGEVKYLLCAIYNITQQESDKKELEKARDMLAMAMDASGLGGWAADFTTGTITLSESARLLHGVPAGQNITLEQLLQTIAPEHRERANQAVQQAVDNKTSFSEEFIIHPINGSTARWVKSTGKAYYNSEGKAIYMAGNMLDITLQKLEEQRKYDFITMVSHELKTPLTVLKSYVQMLAVRAKKTEDSFTAVALDKLHSQIRKMTVLVNSFLNVSRLEAGRTELDNTSFLLDDLIREKVQELVLTTKNYDIYLKPCPHLPVIADREKIGQVIINLLSNASKYSSPGRQVEISCQDEGAMIRINVKDNGVGIKVSDKAKIFDRFYRVENGQTQVIPGIGIGLYLCSEIIRQHQGKIGVDSVLGKGSTFWFTLPLSK